MAQMPVESCQVDRPPGFAREGARWPLPHLRHSGPLLLSLQSGKAGDIDGVWIEPVTAQVTITFFAAIKS
jgi:hypothetical protein